MRNRQQFIIRHPRCIWCTHARSCRQMVSAREAAFVVDFDASFT